MLSIFFVRTLYTDCVGADEWTSRTTREGLTWNLYSHDRQSGQYSELPLFYFIQVVELVTLPL